MVSSSVTGLTSSNVIIVDQAGRLLTNNDNSQQSANSAQIKMTKEMDPISNSTWRYSVTVSRSCQYSCQVTAQMDFSKVEQTSEEYKPNQTPDSAAIRSRKTAKVCKITMAEPVECQVRCQINSVSAPSAPIETNKDNKDGAQTANNRNSVSNSQSDETTNYEVIVQLVTLNGKLVSSIGSVAVIVNYHSQDGENG